MKIALVIIFIFIMHFFIFISENNATISKSDKKKKSNSSKKNKLNEFNEYDNLELNIKQEIIENALKYSKKLKDVKTFTNGSTLAYVTPWNNYGYDIAKLFTNKFSFISPVWLGISYDGNNFLITGSRDIDVKWIMDMKSKNPNVKIVPRLLFENWSQSTFSNVMRSEYIISKCIESITRFLMKYNFDGVVIEMWLQVGAYSKYDSHHFAKHFGQDLKMKNLLFILAIPPPVYSGNHEGYFNDHDFGEILNSVDYFSLMTYDYSNPQNPGPNAPLEWMKGCVELLEPTGNKLLRSKILLGLNFYGYMYSFNENKAIIRHEFIDILKRAQKVTVEWHKDVKEHEFKIKNSDGSLSAVWYPTQQSVEMRIKLAEMLGVGISIWEIGQGLDYFYDIL